MSPAPHVHRPVWPFMAWAAVLLAGLAAPALALIWLTDAARPAALALAGGPILAIGLMGAGMIGGAASGRFWAGVCLAITAGAALFLIARALGLPPAAHPVSAGLALVIASISFAARGALFARSASDKGWWIALAVVAGEAAIVASAWAEPGLWPDWLLVLLPAQWASTAIQTAFAGAGALAAASTLIALAGTGAATLIVVRLWPSRWPYLLMFAAWLGFAALVWHRPAAPLPNGNFSAAQLYDFSGEGGRTVTRLSP